jgi:hypothetical protein
VTSFSSRWIRHYYEFSYKPSCNGLTDSVGCLSYRNLYDGLSATVVIKMCCPFWRYTQFPQFTSYIFLHLMRFVYFCLNFMSDCFFTCIQGNDCLHCKHTYFHTEVSTSLNLSKCHENNFWHFFAFTCLNQTMLAFVWYN